jgi:hypothetical protein
LLIVTREVDVPVAVEVTGREVLLEVRDGELGARREATGAVVQQHRNGLDGATREVQAPVAVEVGRNEVAPDLRVVAPRKRRRLRRGTRGRGRRQTGEKHARQRESAASRGSARTRRERAVWPSNVAQPARTHERSPQRRPAPQTLDKNML